MDNDIKNELAELAGRSKAESSKKDEVKLSKFMTIPDMVKAMAPEIKRALPEVITHERFTRIALSTDETVKSRISDQMYDMPNELVAEMV